MEHLQKKALIFFGFLVGDFEISDIFYKIQKLNGFPITAIPP